MPTVNYTPLATQERPLQSPNTPDPRHFLNKLDKKLAIWTTLNTITSLLSIFLLSSTMYHSQHPETHKTTVAGSLLSPQSFFPHFPRTTSVLFSNSSHFQDDGARADEAWAEILPEGGGALRVQYPRSYDMPVSALVDEGNGVRAEAYAASVTHQLHCLVSGAFSIFPSKESLPRLC